MKRALIKQYLSVSIFAVIVIMMFALPFWKIRNTNDQILHTALVLICLIGFYVLSKKFRQRLVESEERFRLLTYVAKEGVFIHNKGVVYEINNALTTITGYTREEIIGRDVIPLFVHNDDRSIVYHNIEVNYSDPYHVRAVKKDGTLIFVEFHGYNTQHGEKTYRVVSMRDITEQKLIEEKLKNKRRRLTSIIVGTQAGTWEWNIQTGETIFNERWAEIVGYTLAELEPISIKTWEMLVHPDDLKKTSKILEQHFKGELKYYDVDCRIKHKDGRWIWINDRGQVISWTEDGKPLMMFGTHTDITRRKGLEEQIRNYTSVLEKTNIDLFNSKKMLEESLNDKNILVEELLKAKEDLERTNYEKDKFFSIIAHDLRSPFQSFIGLTEVVADNINDFTLQELSGYMNEINSKANNLFNLLKNLLEWAKMQRGVLTFDPKRVNLRRLIEFNIESIKPIAEKKVIKLINNITDDLIIFADENMTGSVISNLLTNAVKFTSHNGQVTFSANKLSDSIVEITISDTGIGMPEKILNNLFKLTEKVGRLGTNGEESTGLGLLLCKDFIEKHDGKIRAESIEGKGSKFIFTLPLMPN